MRITKVETYTVSAGWKNWLFVKVCTDEGVYGIGEATINGFIKTTEAAVHELEHLVIGKDPRQVNLVARSMIKTIQDVGHIHRLAMAGIEVACWDILGKSLGAPIYQLLGGKVREDVLGYANGWYRTERTPESFVQAAETVVGMGFRALKLDPFGLAQGTVDEKELQVAYDILKAIRERFGPDLKIMIDVHCRFTPSESLRVARRLAPLNLFWWEEPTTAEREQLTNEIAAQCPIPVATGEQFDKIGKFMTLAAGGGVSIWQPEPMSLGGITNTLAVAGMAEANGAWIAPHQSGGPVATAICLQIAACVPNFLIQEHFDPFNEAWTKDLVTWRPEIDPRNGHLSLPAAPGLGTDLDLDVVREHPYDPNACFDVHQEGWEKRIGTRAKAESRRNAK
ncbi:MAG: mandelate racemase/muconate lactonizing enzyme family protein [Armatimonadetes bacterium]|nr:mandelate racemase/muconate lactonizing enzyme family protein [Armatimonadota bacterium]